MRNASAALALGAVALAGCIRPPESVLVDRVTALEQQAAGSFAELEQRLTRAAIAPRPVALTPDQLEALGIRPASVVDSNEVSDADRVDALLKQRCIGEARDGTLADTRDACRGASDHDLALTLIDRVNRARVQLWRWMHDRRKEAPMEAIRRAWREAHLRGVVCGGWIERDDGTWEAKRC